MDPQRRQEILTKLEEIIAFNTLEVVTKSHHRYLSHPWYGDHHDLLMCTVISLRDHLLGNKPCLLRNITYNIRAFYGHVIGFADSAETDIEYEQALYQLLYSYKWTLEEVGILPSSAPFFLGNFSIQGQFQNLTISRTKWENEALRNFGIGWCKEFHFPPNTHVIIFEKISHFKQGVNGIEVDALTQEMFELGDQSGKNVICEK